MMRRTSTPALRGAQSGSWRTRAGLESRPTEKHSRNQKRRPGRPPQAEGLPHNSERNLA